MNGYYYSNGRTHQSPRYGIHRVNEFRTVEDYPGTVFFVSDDREFESSLGTRVVEMTADGLVNYRGNYEEYLRNQGVVPVHAKTA